jgi:hypothetical protein
MVRPAPAGHGDGVSLYHSSALELLAATLYSTLAVFPPGPSREEREDPNANPNPNPSPNTDPGVDSKA